MSNLKEWLSMDPAAATAAVLKMPKDGVSRSAAVDMAVETLDSAAALEYYLKSGETTVGSGTSEAWRRQVLSQSGTKDGPDLQRSFLERLTLAQQDGLFAAVAEGIQGRDVSDPMADADLNLLARCVLQTGEVTPGLESFFAELAEYPGAAMEVRQFIESCSQLSPAHKTALEILWAQEMTTWSPTNYDGFFDDEFLDTFSTRTDHQSLRDRTAPSIITNLTASGRLTEALQLLDQVRDPDAQRASLEAVLPKWLEADPSAARAAFASAPLTALERERWEQRLNSLQSPQGP
jgi:hypothetical protein